MTTSPRLLILATGQPVDAMRRHGDFAHWIRVAAGLRRDQVHVVDVQAGQRLPDASAYAGVVVSGSAAMVTQRLGWSEHCAGWLHDAAHGGRAILGICYGHQLLTHALGGEVADNPAGRRMGTVRVQATLQAADDPLFAGRPAAFAAQVTHVQVARTPPPEAVVLACAPHDPHHAFRWRSHVWGVQFHPEFSATHMRGYVRARADALRADGQHPDRLARDVHAAPHARRVLRAFARLARTLSASSDQ